MTGRAPPSKAGPDLEKLAEVARTDPGLALAPGQTVEDLAEHLVAAHRYLIDPTRSGPVGYLYRQQIRRVRELTQELEDARRQQPPGRRNPLQGRD